MGELLPGFISCSISMAAIDTLIQLISAINAQVATLIKLVKAMAPTISVVIPANPAVPSPIITPGPVITGGALAHLTLVNTNAVTATPSESYFTFGLALKKGDCPFGFVPVIQTAGGTILPSQFDLRNSWSDGSLRWCEVSCVGPSLAGGATLGIQVHVSNGVFNNNSVRVLADITSASTICMALTNLTDFNGAVYAGGATSATFNAASAINLEKVKSGPVCDQWKAWMFFPGQGGGTFDQLAAFF